MTRTRCWRALPLLLLLALPAAGQEAERRQMLDKVGPSVVALRNDEGHGSGIVLDEQGTILTSAHVVVSPLPFRVEAIVRDKDRTMPVVFQRMVLIGVHPTRDMAIVRVDPSEHRGKLIPLALAKSRAVTGDLAFAVGYPRSRGGRVKTCTSGEVTGVDQFVDMPGYFQCSAEVHPGNSGGPIVDKSGQAMGLLTWGATTGAPIAFAIPLHDFAPNHFIPLERRPKDPAKASKFLRVAEDLLKMAKEGKVLGGILAADVFQMALLEDISNSDTYFKIGLLQRAYGDYRAAAAYLMRSVQIQPWNDAKDFVYHELGAALVGLGRINDAMTVWNEAAVKYPGEASKVWDALAVAHFETGRFLDAACASRASLRAFGERGGKMNEIYDKARARLDAESITRLTEFERTIESQVQASRKDADKARQEGRRFMTPACEKLVQSFTGIQKEATGFNFSSLGGGPNSPPPTTIPDKELLPLFIRSRVAVAAEHLQNGKIKLAVEALEEVIKSYPDHPDTETARDLLKVINRKK